MYFAVDMWMQDNKVTNLKIAIKKLDGIVIKPGETLSYWKLIGKPNRKKGYREGMVLFYGGFQKGIDIVTMCFLIQTEHSLLEVVQHVCIIIEIYKSIMHQTNRINCIFI